MNHQEIYDRVKTHLLTQNRKSKDSRMQICAYRGDNGVSCALGCLIPDDVYSPAMEGRGIPIVTETLRVNDDYAVLHDALMASGLGPETWDLLRELQMIHDSDHTSEWEWRLKDVARGFGLTP